MVSQVGRPDDGTDTTLFNNTEYFVDVTPKEQWRPVFRQDKEKLIAAMNRELEKIHGVNWSFTQPIADDVDEAVSGVKGQLAVKIYGDDLKTLEQKGDEVMDAMRTVPGIADLGMFRALGQPNLDITVDRDAAGRFQINVADVEDAVLTAVGGNAVGQVLQGEQRFDLVARYPASHRGTKEAIGTIRLLSPSGERVSLAQLCTIKMVDGASEFYREANSRYVGIIYRVRGRNLGGTVEEAISNVTKKVKLPPRYHIEWAGEYENEKRAEQAAAPHRTFYDLSDFLDHLRCFRLSQMGVPASGKCSRGARRRPAGPVHHRDVFQHIFGRGLPGFVRRFGSDRCHYGRLYQPASGARTPRGGGRY